MKQIAVTGWITPVTKLLSHYSFLFVFIAGLFAPLGFAPFHMPGIVLLCLALLFSQLLESSPTRGFLFGFIFGLGFFGLGVSWVIISIHDYGQMNYFFAGFITLCFILYLSLYPAAVGFLFSQFKSLNNPLYSGFVFSSLWCLSEVVRSHFMTGFPWLLMGTSQIDTPIKYLAPMLGVTGLSFFCCLASSLLAFAIRENSIKRYAFLCAFVLMLILPSSLKSIEWTVTKNEPVSVGVVQGNLSMRDKWDEQLFWNLLQFYKKTTEQLLGKQLIILPESAIPLPASYVADYLHKLHKNALKAKSALLFGILEPTDSNDSQFYNSIGTLGKAQGRYTKRHLVPFGAYIPLPFVALNRLFQLPEPNISSGTMSQTLIKIQKHFIASLICYEIAYPHLLRWQLPKAEWIVSISDNGWFGKSLASYQQLQMAQMLSLLTGRYHVVVNNDGLSSVVNTHGEIVEGLPPFSAGILESKVFPASGSTPWVRWGEMPVVVFCSIFLIFLLFLKFKKISKH